MIDDNLEAKLARRLAGMRELFGDASASAVALLVAFSDITDLDGEALGWTPEVLADEIKKEIGEAPHQDNFTKLMAAIQISTSDRAYQSLPDFIDLANAVSGTPLDPTTFDPADVWECAIMLTTMAMLNPPDAEETNPFNPEILGYINAVLDDEGLTTPPRVLAFAVPADRTGKIMGNFSDDPTMFAAVSESSNGRTDDIDKAVDAYLYATASQLEGLILRHGDVSALVSAIRRKLSE